MEQTYKVFVYGTLRQHEVNDYLLKEAKLLARQCWTNGILFDTNCGYPALIEDKTKRVYGELYEVSKEQLKKLDWLEDYTGNKETDLYERIVKTIFTDKGPVEAFVYIFSPNRTVELSEIEFGDWKCHQYLHQEEHLYFAYGSCMDNERFQLAGIDHCFKQIKGCGIAKDYRLAYSLQYHDGGRADMVEEMGWVEGKVYEVNQEAVQYLLQREGVYTNLYRPAFIEVEIDGEVHKNVLTFFVIDKKEELAPPVHYATEILRGSKNFVSDDYYKKLHNDLVDKFKLKL